MLKFSRGKLIVFDIEEALSFEGETGPYLQYAVVRANNILHKLQEREGLSEADVLASLDGLAPDELAGDGVGRAARPLGARLRGLAARRVVEQVVRSLEFSVLAKYAFGLAQLFNAFYHRYPILNEEDRPGSGGGPPASPTSGAADAGARSDGHRGSRPDVSTGSASAPNTMAVIGITASRKLEDYRQAILHVGGEVRGARSRRCR